MSEKRRDSHGRILRNGEIQTSGGRYRYKYTDASGKPRYIYSWRLNKNDHMPAGKKNELSLREKERLVEADIADQIVPGGGGMTVADIVRKYTSMRVNVRPSTKASYHTVISLLQNDEFGNRRIDKIKMSDAKLWLIQLQKNGRGFSTIRTIRGVLRHKCELKQKMPKKYALKEN